jgi:hypothetical protein
MVLFMAHSPSPGGEALSPDNSGGNSPLSGSQLLFIALGQCSKEKPGLTPFQGIRVVLLLLPLEPYLRTKENSPLAIGYESAFLFISFCFALSRQKTRVPIPFEISPRLRRPVGYFDHTLAGRSSPTTCDEEQRANHREIPHNISRIATRHTTMFSCRAAFSK